MSRKEALGKGNKKEDEKAEALDKGAKTRVHQEHQEVAAVRAEATTSGKVACLVKAYEGRTY